MTELLPTLMADDLRSGLVDYLTTTFALADPEAAQALSAFLEDPDDGIFKGPFVRLRLPYRPAADGWQDALDWDPGLTPYGHQAEAYRRLTTIDLGSDKTRPLPTLVTTGTGSGKTEAFLHPILDHCVRANRAGVTGTKALILYPMNALATDQAGRLTELLTTRPELTSVTAGIYTGEQHGTRTTVSKAGLINDRGVMRNSPPDIILTNYKMLDQLLLRPDDQPIWAKSATSLTYLVLDEFHTYDGAQGTDVALLLRRLGLALKAHWRSGDSEIAAEDRLRPLGRVAPVATSATLGDKGDPATMLEFAKTVFGEPFPPDSVVIEARVTLDEWTRAAPAASAGPDERRVLGDLLDTEVVELARGCRERLGDVDALAQFVIGALHKVGDEVHGDLSDPDTLLAQLKALPDVHTLATSAADALSLADVTRLLFPAAITPDEDPDRRLIVSALIAVLSHARALSGRSALSVELNLWIRELTRIDRDASGQTTFSWFDDGARAGGAEGNDAPAFPAIYCRHCGRSGWGVELAATGDDLHADDTNVRGRHARKEGRFRPLLTALAEADLAFGHGPTKEAVDVLGLVWLSTKSRSLQSKLLDPDDVDVLAGRVLPVLTHRSLDADDLSNADTCPSCLQGDGIRFLGSAIATMLSVTLSGMFGNEGLDATEKKALVFTDSVQDAAHRAGFVEARSHTLTFRAMVRDAVGDERCNLDELVERIFQRAGADAFHRYRMVPPDLIGREEFDAWWDTTKPVGVRSKARARVKRRLLFDASLEFGLQSGFGRTLERTGSLAAEVDAGPATKLASIGRRVVAASVDDRLDVPVAATPEADLVAWVRGVLEHMRRQGGIHHEWLKRYLESDGRRFFIWGGRPRSQGMPAFPGGRSAPAFPKVGGGTAGKDPLLVTVTSAQSWYAVWTASALGVSPQHGAKLARDLFDQLVKADVLTKSNTDTGGTVYEIPATSVSVVPLTTADLNSGSTLLVCGICRTQTNGTPEVVGQLDGTPCTVVRCKGRVHRTTRDDNFYRRLYASADMRRIVSREHSSLLEDELRLDYEEQFKSGADNPNAPNVLVATPTLEMGIDIGDLSSVVLASLPNTVASYLQRVGRAGRLTGNALNLAFVSGRGEYLPRLGDPLSVINGEVRPPATYLNAEEILRRQYFASIVDRLARTAGQRMPLKASGALESAGEGSFLHAAITEAEGQSDHLLDAFLSSLPNLTPEAADALKAWATPQRTADDTVGARTSELAATAYEASQRWNALNSELAFRRQEIQTTLPGLQAAAESPAATDDDRRDFRSARGALMLVERHHREHRQKHWIAALEEFGLLPNYTLIDDTVTLDVSVTWRDPDTNEFVSEPRSFNRGAALALREFAPGATFYARGLEMDIDGLDLGSQSALIRRWAWCDTCGYGTDLDKDGTPVSVTVCPRCGSGQIADAGQRFDVVELTRVMSEVRRDEHRIGETRDERKKAQFVMVPAPDFDPSKVTHQWVAGDGQFGVAHYRAMDIRWLNAGRVGAGAVLARNVAGQGIPNTLFRVCASCGKADSETNANARSEHRPWCPQRLSPDESARSVALSRTLTTQGLSLTLPLSVTMGDSFAVPSLAAALLLGLRERMGGNPDHISVVTVPMPVNGGAAGEVRDALLLHDTVPGGTGYLTDLASDAEVWRVLATAHGIVANCECQHENRMACHRCLLPFSRGLGAERLSRVAAERHLRSILLGDEAPEDTVIDPEAPQWVVSQGPVGGGSGESPLELQFRKVFSERMRAINATVKEKPGPSGNSLTITLPNEARVWTLMPQQLAHGSKPDFVLRSSDPMIPPVAIFTDGWTYHASPQHNRLADDAAKRNTLRANDFVVLGITEPDLSDDPSKKLDHQWVSPAIVAALMGQPAGQPGSGINQDAVDVLTGGPIDFLVAWIQQPHHAPRTALADAVWLLLASQPNITTFQLDVSGTVASDVARSLLEGGAAPSSGSGHTGAWWKQGHAGVLTVIDTQHNLPVETVVVIDDSEKAVSNSDHALAWRRWLQLANSLASCRYPLSLAVTSSDDANLGKGVQWSPAGAITKDTDSVILPAAWTSLASQGLSSAELELVTALAERGVGVPEYGAEVGDGIPVDLAWRHEKVAVLAEADADAERDLATDGWVVVRANVESIVEALQSRTGAH